MERLAAVSAILASAILTGLSAAVPLVASGERSWGIDSIVYIHSLAYPIADSDLRPGDREHTLHDFREKRVIRTIIGSYDDSAGRRTVSILDMKPYVMTLTGKKLYGRLRERAGTFHFDIARITKDALILKNKCVEGRQDRFQMEASVSRLTLSMSSDQYPDSTIVYFTALPDSVSAAIRNSREPALDCIHLQHPRY